MKNGYTLVELLAVIIILGIILTIVSPKVLKTIEISKTTTLQYTARKYLDAVEQAVIEKNLEEKFNPNECAINIDGNLTCDEIILNIEADGKKPTSGTITFESRTIVDAELIYGERVLRLDSDGEFIEIIEDLEHEL